MNDLVIFLVGVVVTVIWGSVVGGLLYVAATEKHSDRSGGPGTK